MENEKNKIHWPSSSFLTSGETIKNFPPLDKPHFAFWGRSNVGKSSLMNAIMGRNKLVRTSKHPGQTQKINLFQVQDLLILVDLPGYGYAKVSIKNSQIWLSNTLDYLIKSPNIARVFLLIDGRRGLGRYDHDIIMILNKEKIYYDLVITKIDQVYPKKQQELEKSLNSFAKLQPIPPKVFFVSAKKKISIELLRRIIYDLS